MNTLERLWLAVIINVLDREMGIGLTKIKEAFVVAIIGLLLVSCVQDDFKNIINTQESSIESFFKKYDSSLVTINGRVWRGVETKGDETLMVQEGDSVFFNYKAHLFSNGVGTLFDTNLLEDGLLMGLGYGVDHYLPRKEIIGKGQLLTGLNRGLVGASKGERCFIAFSAKYGYGSKQTAIVPKNSPLIFEIWILDVKKN